VATVLQPESLDFWIGALATLSRGTPSSTIRAIVRSYDDGTFATLCITDDRKSYWIKAIGNPQGNQILVTECVVSGVGELIQAPVRPTALIEIPAAFDGTKYGPARFRAGVAHGSLHLESAEERDELTYFRRDGNPQRRATLAALWDWCMGGDPQWMYDQSADYTLWSFDHGFWLGGDGGDWDAAVLKRLVHRDWSWSEELQGTDPASLAECARTLRSITSDAILSVLAKVPPQWGTSDKDLETLGWFLFARKSEVADRIEAKALTLRQSKRKGQPT
jgi:hypothetical protein